MITVKQCCTPAIKMATASFAKRKMPPATTIQQRKDNLHNGTAINKQDRLVTYATGNKKVSNHKLNRNHINRGNVEIELASLNYKNANPVSGT